MKKLMIVFGTVATVAGGAFFVYSRQPEKADVNDAPVAQVEKKQEEEKTIHTVELADVTEREMHRWVVSTATLQSEREVDIFSKVGGQIKSLPLEEGQRVEAGDLLLEVDGGDARLKLDQTRVNLEKAKAEFSRIEKSYKKELVSTEEYETRKYQLESSQAEYDLASYQVSITEVTAPFSGTITSRKVELGQTIQPADKLFTIAAMDVLKAEVYLPESKVSDLKEGMTVQLSKDEHFENKFPGVVSRIAPVVDRETGTVKVTLAIEESPESVRPGAYVHLQILTHTEIADRVVPKKALVFDSHRQAHVFIARPNKEKPDVYSVEKAMVKTGLEEGSYVVLTEGVNPSDQIVLTGKASLKEGALVRNVSNEVQTLASN